MIATTNPVRAVITFATSTVTLIVSFAMVLTLVTLAS
jgi:hypothetical protein